VLQVVPLLRAEGGEKESQVGLAPEDGRPTEAETMIPELLKNFSSSSSSSPAHAR